MITDKAETYEVANTLKGERIKMIVEESAMMHIMDALTNLYTDPERAVIREYSTNARDSHIEAGQTRPIEVNLPGPLKPTLEIQDWGVGMDLEDIRQIYSRYGKSTKTDTNTQVGMLGFGCKSGLAYAPQFTLVGVKDGRKTAVSVSRDEDGAGAMTVLEAKATDEPNGVKIIIPVKARNDIPAKVNEFFQYWDEGTVLVNGKPPKRFEGDKVCDGLYVAATGHWNAQDCIVMGGVAYPATLNDRIIRNTYQVIAFVDIGDVNFAPSREALRPTQKTNNTIANIREKLKNGLEAAAERAIANASSYPEALSESVKWRNVFNGRSTSVWKYKNKEVPERFTTPGRDIVITSKSDYKLSSHSRYNTVEANLCTSSLFVHGYAVGTFTANHKKKLNKYVEDSNIENISSYVLTPTPIDNLWIPKTRTADWEEISKIKIPRNTVNSRGRISGSYDMVVDGNLLYECLADDIDSGQPLFYITSDYYSDSKHFVTEWEKLLTKYRPGCTIVRMGMNRVAKFQRDFPTAKRFDDQIKELYSQIITPRLTPDIKEALTLRATYSAYSFLVKMDHIRIDDPALAKYVKMAHIDLSDLSSRIAEFEKCGFRINVDRHNNEATTALFDAYPLCAQLRNTQHMDHIYTYINAWYNQNKEN